MSILIGVAGGTGSGKTSFARKLLARLGPERCLLIAQDAYYKDGSALDPRLARPSTTTTPTPSTPRCSWRTCAT